LSIIQSVGSEYGKGQIDKRREAITRMDVSLPFLYRALKP
jgi:hypothetical protein